MLWSLVNQQFLNLIFDENTFNKYKFKIFFEKFVLFYVDGYTFPSKYDVFSVHNSFPTYKLAEEGQSWQGMQCKKKLLTIANSDSGEGGRVQLNRYIKKRCNQY